MEPIRPWSYVDLTNGGFALVDDDDLDLLDGVSWRHVREGLSIYAIAGRRLRMHRLILDAPDGVMVDHRNGNGLDNRRSNLRLCTNSQNQANRQKRSSGSAPYRGVTWHKQAGKWQAAVKVGGKNLYLGLFHSAEAAGRAYDAMALEHFGEFAVLNFPTAREVA